MSSILHFSALPSWPYLFASSAAFVPIGFFITAQTHYARAMCAEVGFAQPLSPNLKLKGQQSQEPELNSLFYLLANKEAVIGLVLLALQAAGEWKAVGIMLMCVCVCGGGDMYVSVTRGSFGLWKGFQRIGLIKCIGIWAAWRICEENW